MAANVSSALAYPGASSPFDGGQEGAERGWADLDEDPLCRIRCRPS